MIKPLLKVSLAAAAAVALAALGVSSAMAAPNSAKPTAKPAATTDQMYVTYYGWYDNSPPGCATAYGGCAGGAGTFSNPITFATDKAELSQGTKIYIPQVEKYFVMKDDCTECDQDWTSKGPSGLGPHYRHVDAWIGGKNGTEFDVINCEDALTLGTASGGPLQESVIVNPPSGEKVSSFPLFYGGANSDVCDGGVPYPASSYGQYKNAGTGDCINIAAPTSGAAANEAPCTGAADQDLAFDGSFFLQDNGNLCLQAKGGSGSGMDWSGCGGGPPEQFEVNGNGTISGVQSSLCIQAAGNSIKVAGCNGSNSEVWNYTSEPAPTTAP